MKTLAFVSAVLLAMAAPASAQEAAPALAPPPDYANPADWLCLPGRDDACAKPLPTVELGPNGYGATTQVKPAANPPIDCFYVYPTVSRDPGDNSDLVPGPEERAVAAVQFARYGTVCRTFAPMYRQATLTALRKAMSGAGRFERNLEPAYADVLAAWRSYLAHDNHGRPFVLIGHSQGSILIERLIASEIENSPAAARMLSAVIAGFNVEVPEGKLVGGTFKKTPLCSHTGETGCVLAWTSFRAASPPPEQSLFGRAPTPGMTVGCTNPARLGSDAPAPLDSYWYAGPSLSNAQQTAWSSEGPPPAPFLHTRGLASGACVHRGNVGYFAITVNADPKDKRTDEIPGDVVILGQRQPGWGMHLADMNLPMGDVIRLIEAQRDALLRRH